MHTHGARETRSEPREGPTRTGDCPDGARAPTHDLLVMSHGPDAHEAAGSNHACLNSFRSSSWIMASGGRPKTMVGR
jgi:hypothetical protein